MAYENSFAQLEQIYKSMPITGNLSTGVSFSGLLSLNKQQSEVIISLGSDVKIPRNDGRFVSLPITASNGCRILLHKTFPQGWNSYGDTHYTQNLFANVLVFQAPDFGGAQYIGRISFVLKDLSTFFQYRHFGWGHDFSHPGGRDIILRIAPPLLLGGNVNPELRNIYATYSPVEPFDPIEVGNTKVSVFFEQATTGRAWDEISVKVTPRVDIEFVEPVLLDDAIDSMRQLQYFFNQMTLSPMHLEGAWISWADHPPYRPGSLYFATAEDPVRQVSAHKLPMNHWEERETLGQALRQWMLAREQRLQFRRTLNQAIIDFSNVISVDIITNLCAAVESLRELDTPPSIEKALIDELSSKLFELASEKGVDIEKARFSGLLGQLNRPSLSLRLKIFFSKLGPYIKEQEANTLIKKIAQFRNLAAHGGKFKLADEPFLAPTVQAFLGCCSMYDLHLSGAPMRTKHGRYAKTYDDTISALRALSLGGWSEVD